MTEHPLPRILLFCISLMVFVVAAAIGCSQANQSRQIIRKNRKNDAEWQAADFVEATYCASGRLCSHMGMPSAATTNAAGTSPRVRVEVPYARRGYALNIAVRKADPADLPRLEVLVNGRSAGSFLVKRHHPSHPGLKDCREIFLDPSLMRSSGENHLVIQNVKGGKWQGRVLLIPYGSWRRAIQLLLPFSACAVLLSSLSFRTGRWRYVRPILLFAVFLLVYYYTGFTKKMAPIGEFVWDDAGSFTRYVMANALMDDMKKHMLFLPVMHGMWWGMMKLSGGMELFALAAAFAWIAALNVVIAFLWLRRRLGTEMSGMLVTVLYAFSFSVWIYSSMVESYILSALFVNLFMLAVVSRWPGRGPVRMALLSPLVVLAALAHPPLLILFGVLVVKAMLSDMRVTTKVWLPIVLGAAVLACFVGGQSAIRNAYDVNRRPSVQRETKFMGKVLRRYARAENMTPGNAGNVVLGQFVYALGGFPHGHRWYKGWSGFVDYFRTVYGAAFAVLLVAFWSAVVAGLVRSRAHALRSALLSACVMGPYLVFFWYFNPAEMLLYSAPMMSMILGWSIECGGAALGRRRDILVALLLLFTVVLNTVVMVSYC